MLFAFSGIITPSGCGGMVDTLALGASGGNPVEVQVLSSVPKNVPTGRWVYSLAGVQALEVSPKSLS